MIYGDFEKITQFHHRMLYPLVFPKGLICPERIAFQSDVPRKYEAGKIGNYFNFSKFLTKKIKFRHCCCYGMYC